MPGLEKQPEFPDEASADKVKTAALLIGHGSRAENANESLFRVVAHFRKAWPHRVLEAAFLEISRPSIPEGIDLCVEKGAERIIAIPYFLFRGNHVKMDLPALIEESRNEHADVDIILGPHLGFHPKMIEIVDERVRQALDTLKPEETPSP